MDSLSRLKKFASTRSLREALTKPSESDKEFFTQVYNCCFLEQEMEAWFRQLGRSGFYEVAQEAIQAMVDDALLVEQSHTYRPRASNAMKIMLAMATQWLSSETLLETQSASSSREPRRKVHPPKYVDLPFSAIVNREKDGPKPSDDVARFAFWVRLDAVQSKFMERVYPSEKRRMEQYKEYVRENITTRSHGWLPPIRPADGSSDILGLNY